jgi:hypothetical protein
MKLKVSELKELAIKNGGFSLNKDGKVPVTGYMISCKDLYKITLSDLTPDKLDNAILEASKINGFIGGWLDVNSDDKNNFYLDISINIKDKDEAIELAKKNNQLAIFDIATGESIYL